jgi:hypothetical protein
MNIEAGSGHSRIEKDPETERMVAKFELGACMPVDAPGVAMCCKVPGNLKTVRRDGDIIKYRCIVCDRKHNVAFSAGGELILRGMAALTQRSYVIAGDLGSSDVQGSDAK